MHGGLCKSPPCFLIPKINSTTVEFAQKFALIARLENLVAHSKIICIP